METEIPAPVSGVVSAILVAEGSTVQVGAALAVIEEEGKPRAIPAPAPAPAIVPADGRRSTRPAGPPAREGEPPLSPVVRRLLAEHGLDASAITGTGAGGRITRDDVLAQVEKRKSGTSPRTDELPRTRPDGEKASVPGAEQDLRVRPCVLTDNFSVVKDCLSLSCEWIGRRSTRLPRID